MRKTILMTILLTFFISVVATNAADKKSLPSIKLKNLAGKSIDSKEFDNAGKPLVINFWATWCKPCISELNNIHDKYEKWQKETGVKIIAVSIDDSRNARKVAPFVKGRGWNYEVYVDENSDFRRALNVNNPPHTFLLDGNGEIVYEHNGYAPGDEEKLYDEIKKLVKK